jgi:hypothetical protein
MLHWLSTGMIVHGFDMYRVYLSTPGDLAREQDACRAAISEVNANEAMPLKILLVSVGLREDGQIVGFRSAVADNIRQCTYFIQVFEDDWGPNNLFRKMFHLAAECRDDAGLPMREAIVCLKDAPHETDPATLAFRKELEDRQDMRVLHFDKSENLKTQLIEICKGWVRSIADAGGGANRTDNARGAAL